MAHKKGGSQGLDQHAPAPADAAATGPGVGAFVPATEMSSKGSRRGNNPPAARAQTPRSGSAVSGRAGDATREVEPDKEYGKYLKKARATLAALEGREREVGGLAPDYAEEIATLLRLQAMNNKLLKRMRARKRDFDKTLRELRTMLDERDDFVSTRME